MVTHFSDYTSGEHVMFMLGFLSMTLFGAFYYVVPRLTGADFSSRYIPWHFWLFVWGAGTMFVCLTLGGLIQGFALNDPNVNFMSSLSAGVSLSSDERAGSDGGFRRHDCLCHRVHSQFA